MLAAPVDGGAHRFIRSLVARGDGRPRADAGTGVGDHPGLAGSGAAAAFAAPFTDRPGDDLGGIRIASVGCLAIGIDLDMHTDNDAGDVGSQALANLLLVIGLPGLLDPQPLAGNRRGLVAQVEVTAVSGVDHPDPRDGQAVGRSGHQVPDGRRGGPGHRIDPAAEDSHRGRHTLRHAADGPLGAVVDVDAGSTDARHGPDALFEFLLAKVSQLAVTHLVGSPHAAAVEKLVDVDVAVGRDGLIRGQDAQAHGPHLGRNEDLVAPDLVLDLLGPKHVDRRVEFAGGELYRKRRKVRAPRILSDDQQHGHHQKGHHDQGQPSAAAEGVPGRFQLLEFLLQELHFLVSRSACGVSAPAISRPIRSAYCGFHRTRRPACCESASAS